MVLRIEIIKKDANYLNKGTHAWKIDSLDLLTSMMMYLDPRPSLL